MYAICIESSRTRGMGHLFRSFQYINYMEKCGIKYIYLINDDEPSLEILRSRNIPYILVDFSDHESNWEAEIAKEYHIKVWINDKFDTHKRMGERLSNISGMTFCAIDDVGEGAVYADLFFAGIVYPTLKSMPGKKNFGGSEYIILNPELEQYKRKRENVQNIIVTLGGSDPFGATVEVVEELKDVGYEVDIVVGPNFAYMNELKKITPERFNIFQHVPSLMRMFFSYDLAITGGGVTCCEACASGLPCVIIANAPHEVNTGKYIESLQLGIYAGEHGTWDRKILKEIEQIPIADMSQRGMNCFRIDAIEKIFCEIRSQIGENADGIL